MFNYCRWDMMGAVLWDSTQVGPSCFSQVFWNSQIARQKMAEPSHCTTLLPRKSAAVSKEYLDACGGKLPNVLLRATKLLRCVQFIMYNTGSYQCDEVATDWSWTCCAWFCRRCILFDLNPFETDAKSMFSNLVYIRQIRRTAQNTFNVKCTISPNIGGI